MSPSIASSAAACAVEGGTEAAPAERWEALLAASFDAAVVVGAGGVIAEASDAAGRLFGVPRERLAGRALVELVRIDGRVALLRLLSDAAHQGRAIEPALPIHRADGSDGVVEVSAAAVGAAGSGQGAAELVLVLRDVTERLRVERQLREGERLITVGTLVAGIAHEIANPVSYVLNNLAQLGSYEERLREALQRISDLGARPADLTALLTECEALLGELDEVVHESVGGGERIRAIAADLRTFSRADDSGLGPVQLEDELEAVLRLARSELRYRATIRRDYAGNLPPVAGNAGRISQLLLNLVLNAAQAMDEGGPGDNVLTVRTALEGGGVRVEIGDTGAGIAPEVLPRIFEPFFTTKPAGQGTGLGLAICRDIARRYGGEIHATSTPGQGSTFLVWLPLSPPANAQEAPVASGIPIPSALRTTARFLDDDAPGSPAPSAPSAPPQLPVSAAGRRRILVVDDEPCVLATWKRALGGHHEVITADNGRVAVERILDGPPIDVILCDLAMPELDGPALFEAVARLRPGLERRMIFVTGGVFNERCGAFLRRVDNPRLEKPVGPDELLDAVAALAGSDGVPS